VAAGNAPAAALGQAFTSSAVSMALARGGFGGDEAAAKAEIPLIISKHSDSIVQELSLSPQR
jgi:hypothetical protein